MLSYDTLRLTAVCGRGKRLVCATKCLVSSCFFIINNANLLSLCEYLRSQALYLSLFYFTLFNFYFNTLLKHFIQKAFVVRVQHLRFYVHCLADGGGIDEIFR